MSLGELTPGKPQHWGPPAPSVMVQRPPRINEAVRKMLKEGTVDDLFTPHGELLRELMTPNEQENARLNLPMRECPGFDLKTLTCDRCRGNFRWRQCPSCHGECDPRTMTPPAGADAAAAPKEEA